MRSHPSSEVVQQRGTRAFGGGNAEVSSQRSKAIQMLRSQPYSVQTEALRPSLPVQLDGKGARQDTDAIHQAAAHGIQGSGGSMPHLGAIQQSFGAHDVSSIQAHTGSAATQANEAMGAEAYATGNHVAFKGTPDLHTAAHEAAHVVQQRSGVSVPGGVGSVGDTYEQHADKVADAVVAGQSAEGLLSEMSGGGRATDSVQMAKRGDQSQEGGTQTDLSANQVDKKEVVDEKGETKEVPTVSTTEVSIDDPLKHPYYKTFHARVLALFKSDHIAAPKESPATLAAEIWKKICAAAKAARPPMTEPAAYSNFEKKWIDMDLDQYQQAMKEFDQVTTEIAGYADLQFDTAQSYGFWSEDAGRELAEDMSDVTLETSGLGGLFDGIPNLNGNVAGWNPGLWGGLSKSYAEAVVKNWESGKRIHVCVGPGARIGNIWDKVESITLEKGLEDVGTILNQVTQYHGAAVTRTSKKKVDFRVGSTFKGAVYSGDSREEAIKEATKYAAKFHT